MGITKTGRSTRDELLHYSVGAIIKHEGKYLLINRATPPYGYACLAGHIDQGEEPLEALKREVSEESGLILHDAKLLFEEEMVGNWCNQEAQNHYWYVYEGSVSGTIDASERETKSIGWYTQEEIYTLDIEPGWHYFFEKLKLLP